MVPRSATVLDPRRALLVAEATQRRVERPAPQKLRVCISKRALPPLRLWLVSRMGDHAWTARQLAVEVGYSETQVREALHALLLAGAVDIVGEVRPRRGPAAPMDRRAGHESA
jgi:hypothetical protein